MDRVVVYDDRGPVARHGKEGTKMGVAIKETECYTEIPRKERKRREETLGKMRREVRTKRVRAGLKLTTR